MSVSSELVEKLGDNTVKIVRNGQILRLPKQEYDSLEPVNPSRFGRFSGQGGAERRDEALELGLRLVLNENQPSSPNVASFLTEEDVAALAQTNRVVLEQALRSNANNFRASGAAKAQFLGAILRGDMETVRLFERYEAPFYGFLGPVDDMQVEARVNQTERYFMLALEALAEGGHNESFQRLFERFPIQAFNPSFWYWKKRRTDNIQVVFEEVMRTKNMALLRFLVDETPQELMEEGIYEWMLIKASEFNWEDAVRFLSSTVLPTSNYYTLSAYDEQTPLVYWIKRKNLRMILEILRRRSPEEVRGMLRSTFGINYEESAIVEALRMGPEASDIVKFILSKSVRGESVCDCGWAPRDGLALITALHYRDPLGNEIEAPTAVVAQIVRDYTTNFYLPGGLVGDLADRVSALAAEGGEEAEAASAAAESLGLYAEAIRRNAGGAASAAAASSAAAGGGAGSASAASASSSAAAAAAASAGGGAGRLQPRLTIFSPQVGEGLRVENYELSPLLACCKFRQTDTVECARLLLDAGADPNEMHEDTGNTTPLLEACRRNNLPLARFLLDRGADPNTASKRFTLIRAIAKAKVCESPLLVAVVLGNRELIELLLSRGANPELSVTVKKPNSARTKIQFLSALLYYGIGTDRGDRQVDMATLQFLILEKGFRTSDEEFLEECILQEIIEFHGGKLFISESGRRLFLTSIEGLSAKRVSDILRKLIFLVFANNEDVLANNEDIDYFIVNVEFLLSIDPTLIKELHKEIFRSIYFKDTEKVAYLLSKLSKDDLRKPTTFPGFTGTALEYAKEMKKSYRATKSDIAAEVAKSQAELQRILNIIAMIERKMQ